MVHNLVYEFKHLTLLISLSYCSRRHYISDMRYSNSIYKQEAVPGRNCCLKKMSVWMSHGLPEHDQIIFELALVINICSCSGNLWLIQTLRACSTSACVNMLPVWIVNTSNFVYNFIKRTSLCTFIFSLPFKTCCLSTSHVVTSVTYFRLFDQIVRRSGHHDVASTRRTQ